MRRFGGRIGRKALSVVTGSRYLRIDDHILQVLATRQLFLIRALQARGHAAIERIAVADFSAPALWQGGLPTVLRKVREHPQWSGLYQSTDWDSGRQRALDEIATTLDTALADTASR